MSPDTLAQIGEIQKALAPFTEDRSSTLRVIVELVHAMIFTPGTLQAVLDSFQRLLRTTSQYQLQFRFPSHPEAISLRPRIFQAGRALQ